MYFFSLYAIIRILICMFVYVRLLTGFNEPLIYKVPQSLTNQKLLGAIVQVPLRNRIVPAIVTDSHVEKPDGIKFAIKEITALEQFPHDPNYLTFLEQLSWYYQVEPMHFLKRMRQFLKQKEIKHEVHEQKTYSQKTDVQLTDEQQKVVNFLLPKIDEQVYTPTVLHGVTGSGKTEIYKQLITHTLDQNKNILLLLPEVTLAVEFEKRLRYELPDDIPIYSFHSATSAKQKRLLWERLVNQEPMLIIGVHLPILLPISSLGCIIIDEEHEVGYQEKKHPKINSKETAIIRAQMNNIPILLGSATPSLQTLHNVKTKGWHFFQLKKRFAGAFPTVKTVFLQDKKQRKNFWISDQLLRAIKYTLEKKEQAIIFLNRRGYSFFVQCTACSFIFQCPDCSVSLTLHNNYYLNCHYCEYKLQQPTKCPECKADESEFLKKGIGTQQLVTILEKLLPEACIARADLDTTVKRKKWQQTMQDFADRKIDILVGTQTITKGYDFPGVTLVGVLWADLNLHFPIFNAAETTLQQLIQVAGRAGRKHVESTVIVQAMGEHDIFNFINETDYLQFFAHAMQQRNMLGYPPYKRLVEIELKSTNEEILERESHDLVSALFAIKTKNKFGVQILGPAKPPVYKIKRTFMRKIYIKGMNIKEMTALFNAATIQQYQSSIFFTPNPVT